MADFITDTQLNGYKDAINKKIAAKYDGMRGAFAAFDADGDGKISRKEIARALAGFRLNISRNHLEQVFELADSNGDGGIDYDEFVQMLRKFDMNDAMSRFMSTLEGGDGLPRLAPTPPPGGAPRAAAAARRAAAAAAVGREPAPVRIYTPTRPESSGGRQPSSAGRECWRSARLNVENARLRDAWRSSRGCRAARCRRGARSRRARRRAPQHAHRPHEPG